MRTLIVVLALTGAALTAAAQAARPSPAIEIRVGNAPLDLSQYRGKVVALAFIDTNCPHCQDLTRTLIPISRGYGPRGVQVVECAFNDGAEGLLPRFIQQFQPPFPVGWTTRSAVLSYLQISILDTRPLYVPHMVFIDRRGLIRDDYRGESSFFTNSDTNIRAELDKLLTPTSAVSKSRP